MDLTVAAIAEAGRQGVQIICLPECYTPGYRWRADTLPPPSLPFLESAWERVGAAARLAGISVILDTERPTEPGLKITAGMNRSNSRWDHDACLRGAGINGATSTFHHRSRGKLWRAANRPGSPPAASKSPDSDRYGHRKPARNCMCRSR